MAWTQLQWQTRLRTLASDHSNIAWTDHARMQLRCRDISMDMAIDVISKGSIHMAPELDIRTGHTVCRMERFCAGKHLAICVALESQTSSRCIIVTVMERKIRQ